MTNHRAIRGAWVGVAFLATVASPLLAMTHRVSPDGSGDYPTIQAAIDAASSGDEIMLADGIFTGDGNWDLNFETKELLLRSVNGYEATTIDCGCFDDPNWSKHRGIILEGGQTAATQVEGITVQSSYIDSDLHGGAFRIVGASPLIRSVRIQRNPAVERGAGMFVQGGSPAIEDCVFIGYYGGSAWGSAICGEQSSPSVRRCSFNAFHGIAVFVDGGTFEDCTFTDNLGPGDYQGIALSATGVSILRCTFRNTFGSSVTVGSGSLIDGCHFESNVGDYGAGVRGTNMTIRNSVFLRNWSGFTGSAVDCGGVTTIDHCVFAHNDKDAVVVRGTSALIVSRCTFVGNGTHTYFPEGPGSSIASVWGSPSINIDHSIIAFGWGSASTAVNCYVAPAELSVTCSDVFGNPGGDWVGCLAGMETAKGNLSADPLFCDVVAGNFGLQADSPCAPANAGECGLIGALGVSCGPTSVEARTWGSIKALYR